MEFYPKDDLDISVEPVCGESNIYNTYFGSHIFITGGTGFMGKILLEKVLRTCDVARVYLLIREKKGKTQSERLQELLSDAIFERVRMKHKNPQDMITVIEGDCMLPDLGLSEADRLMIQDNVNFVFHAAATVVINDHLRKAYCTNLYATKCLLDLAKTITKLKAFVYVSTAYTQVALDDIEEKFYPTEYSIEEVDNLVRNMDDSQLSAITPLLVGKLLNTYSFTKAIAEYLVSKYHHQIPVAVARPSIVISTVREPIVGWIDNVYGAIGVLAGAMAGLLRVWRSKPDAVADLIPVDVAINAILAIGWHIAEHKPQSHNEILFNLVSFRKNPITWQQYMDLNRKTGLDEQLATMVSVGSYDFRLQYNFTFFWFYMLILQVIPGFFFDMFLKLTRMQPKLLYAYRKIYKMNLSLGSYCCKQFNYDDYNVDNLWSLMNNKDRELFNFDQTTYTYSAYFRYLMRGVRVYLFKDGMETLNASISRYYRFYYFMVISRSVIVLAIGWLLYCTFCRILY